MNAMTDLVHKCLVCNEIAYEIEAEFSDEEQTNKTYVLYECSKCNFTWEVVSCGKQGSL